MDSYTITIAPTDASGSSTTLVVDATGGQVRITDVHLHAPAGLASGHIPQVDFGLLLRAVGVADPAGSTHSPDSVLAASVGPAAIGPATPVADRPESPLAAPARRGTRKAARPVAEAPAAARPRRRRAATPAVEPAPARAARSSTTTTTRGAAGKRTNAAKPAAAAPVPAKEQAPAPSRSRRQTPAAPKATPARRAAEPAAATGRVYRRMPADLAKVFAQAGTAAAVAEHYEVPRYTAQGWVSRLRNATT